MKKIPWFLQSQDFNFFFLKAENTFDLKCEEPDPLFTLEKEEIKAILAESSQ